MKDKKSDTSSEISGLPEMEVVREPDTGGAAAFEKDPRREERAIINQIKRAGQITDDIITAILNLMITRQYDEDAMKIAEVHEKEAESIRSRMDMDMEAGRNVVELLDDITNYITRSTELQGAARGEGKTAKNVSALDYALNEHSNEVDFNNNQRLVYRWFYYPFGTPVPYLNPTAAGIKVGDLVTTRQYISTSSHKRLLYDGLQNRTRIDTAKGEQGPRTFARAAIITRSGIPVGGAQYKTPEGREKTQEHSIKFAKTKQVPMEHYYAKHETAKEKLEKAKKGLFKYKSTLIELKKAERHAAEEVKGLKEGLFPQAEVLINRWAVFEVKAIKPELEREIEGHPITDFNLILEEKTTVPPNAEIKDMFTGNVIVNQSGKNMSVANQRRGSLDGTADGLKNQSMDVENIPVDHPKSLKNLLPLQQGQILQMLKRQYGKVMIDPPDREILIAALQYNDGKTLAQYTITRNALFFVIEKKETSDSWWPQLPEVDIAGRLKEWLPKFLFTRQENDDAQTINEPEQESQPPENADLLDFFEARDAGGGGNCLFYSISAGLKIRRNVARSHEQLRADVVEYYNNNKRNLWRLFKSKDNKGKDTITEGESTFYNFDDYIHYISKLQNWAGENEIYALSNILQVNIILYSNRGDIEVPGITNTLLFSPGGPKTGDFVQLQDIDMNDPDTIFIINRGNVHFQVLVAKN